MEALTRLKEFLRGLPARWQEGLRRRGGFNTMDVTAALAITATLAAVVIPSVKGSMDNARVNSLMQEITNIRNGLLKFNSDTNQMPQIVAISDVADINGNRAGGGVGGGSSGLRVNDKPIITWQGPYLDKDVGNNPFGGVYRLEYDTFVPVDVTDPKTGAKVTDRKSAMFVVTGLSPGVSDKVDSALDDGVFNTGIIQIQTINKTGGAGTEEVLVVVLLPAVQIDGLTGLVK